MFKVDLETLRVYRDYTYERASIYYKKNVLKEAPPYTLDLYLSKYKFTNIRRELDKQSEFLIDTVVNANISLENKILNIALFRCINHSEGVQRLKQWPIDFCTFDLAEYVKFEVENPSNKLKQSNAYLLTSQRKIANKLVQTEFRYKQSTLAHLILLNKDKLINAYFADSPELSYEYIKSVESFGPFIAYQIWVDFTYIKEYKFTEDDFTISGPGSDNGIDWMIAGTNIIKDDGKLDYKIFKRLYPENTYEDFLHWFRNNVSKLMKDNGIDWDPTIFQHYLPKHQQDWGLQCVENSMCELSKLMKLRNNIKMRVRYHRHNTQKNTAKIIDW